MNLSLTLQTLAVALAMVCVGCVPFTFQRDLGLSRRIVRMDALPRMRWPSVLTRIGAACMLLSFALLVYVCLFILNGTPQ